MRLLVLFLFLLTAAPASAEVHLDVEALTDFPLDVGARVAVELPYRLRLSTSLGFMPQPYSNTINSFLVDLNVYDAQVGTLITTALSHSFVWRTHLGWRPFASLGLYIDAGYGLVSLGGGLSSQDAVQAGTTARAQASATSSSNELNINSTLHMIDVEIGYGFVFWRHFVVRVALGGAFTVGASTSITSTRAATQNSRAFQTFAAAAADYLNGTYKSYVFSPVATLALGYRFF